MSNPNDAIVCVPSRPLSFQLTVPRRSRIGGARSRGELCVGRGRGGHRRISSRTSPAGATSTSSPARNGCTSPWTPTRSRRRCPPRASSSTIRSRSPRPATTRSGTASASSSSARRSPGGSTAATWKTISPDELTTDLMEVDFFCEVAWLKMGDASSTPASTHWRSGCRKNRTPGQMATHSIRLRRALHPSRSVPPPLEVQAGRGRPRSHRPRGEQAGLRAARADRGWSALVAWR